MRKGVFVLLASLAYAGEMPMFSPAKKLATGFRFVEGPAADGKGNVFFTDIPNQRIHRIDAKGKVTVFREKSGRANGLMFNAAGELVACEGGSGCVVALSMDGKRRVLAHKYNGVRFNAPNDLVIDREGGIYFTDPKFGRDPTLPQKTYGVYYIPPKGEVRRLLQDLPKPNGIHMAPDQKTLYVVCSGSERVLSYPIEKPGALGKQKHFMSLKQPEGRTNTGGDGLTVDAKGRLYITSRLGLQVVSPEGKLLGVLKIPEGPANVTLVNDVLYVTARTSVYTLTRVR